MQDAVQPNLTRHIFQGNNLADQLNAHFLTSEANQRKSNFYNSFFREVCDKKAEIEKAFSMDDRLSGRLDDSGEGTLERPPRRHPIPPPRIDSYHIRDRGPSSLNSRSGSGRSGSGSEIFDRLPDSGLHGDELDGRNSDDSDVYSQIDSLDRQKVIQILFSFLKVCLFRRVHKSEDLMVM